MKFFVCLAILLCGLVYGQEDPGRAQIGELTATVYFATDGDPSEAGENAKAVSDLIQKRLRAAPNMEFAHYRTMGADTKPVFRSYENWAEPLKPSDEILLRFETSSQPRAGEFSVDLELWLARKKIMKTDLKFEADRPLFVLGPEWRGGRLIVAVSLAPD